jgi:hypothetical protein
VSGFVFGVVVGVVTNLVTALFSRAKALRVLPWLLFYILAHGTVVALQSDPAWRVTMAFAKRFSNETILSYLIVMAVAASLSALYLKAARFAVSHLENHTAEAMPRAVSPIPAFKTPDPALVPTPKRRGVATPTPAQLEAVAEAAAQKTLAGLPPSKEFPAPAPSTDPGNLKERIDELTLDLDQWVTRKLNAELVAIRSTPSPEAQRAGTAYRAKGTSMLFENLYLVRVIRIPDEAVSLHYGSTELDRILDSIKTRQGARETTRRYNMRMAEEITVANLGEMSTIVRDLKDISSRIH